MRRIKLLLSYLADVSQIAKEEQVRKFLLLVVTGA